MPVDNQRHEQLFFTDRIVGLVNDFPDAFARNPVLVERGIGLQPEAFADFHFNPDYFISRRAPAPGSSLAAGR